MSLKAVSQKLQNSQRLPGQPGEGSRALSTDRLPCVASTAGEGVYRGRNDEGAGLLNRLAQQAEKRVVDARVRDASRSEEQFHSPGSTSDRM